MLAGGENVDSGMRASAFGRALKGFLLVCVAGINIIRAGAGRWWCVAMRDGWQVLGGFDKAAALNALMPCRTGLDVAFRIRDRTICVAGGIGGGLWLVWQGSKQFEKKGYTRHFERLKSGLILTCLGSVGVISPKLGGRQSLDIVLLSSYWVS